MLGVFQGHGSREDIRNVDDHSHTRLAMLSLTAVQPDWLRVVDHNSVSRGSCIRCLDGHEARVDTRYVASCRDGRTWLCKGGLCDGVVVGCELELYHVSHRSFDIVG